MYRSRKNFGFSGGLRPKPHVPPPGKRALHAFAHFMDGNIYPVLGTLALTAFVVTGVVMFKSGKFDKKSPTPPETRVDQQHAAPNRSSPSLRQTLHDLLSLKN